MKSVYLYWEIYGDLVVYSNVEQRLRSAGQVCRSAMRTEKCRHLSRAGGHFLPWAWSSLGLAFKPGSHGWSYTSARSHFTFPQVLHFTFGTYIMIVQSNKFFFWKLSGYKLINGFASFILWKWLALQKLSSNPFHQKQWLTNKYHLPLRFPNISIIALLRTPIIDMIWVTK